MNNVNNSNAISSAVSSAVVSSDAVLGSYHDWDSQLSIPVIAGTRIIKCLYKASSIGGKKSKVSQYVRVKTEHITEETAMENMIELLPYIVSYLQGIEDSMIKADHAAGLTSVYNDGLSLAKIIEKLEQDELGSRLNKEIIEAWYVESVQQELTAKFAAKLGIDLNGANVDEALSNKLDSIIGAYKKKFSSLAGGKTSLHEDDCRSLIAVIDSLEEKSFLGQKFKLKLEKMMLSDDDLLLAL